jgi:hypothetical protein
LSESYYDPYWTIRQLRIFNVPLESNGCLHIGYGPDNAALPWSYFLRDGQEVDVGFVKLFLTTEPADLSGILQPSPFDHHYNKGRHPYKPEFPAIWDAIVVDVVQRRQCH